MSIEINVVEKFHHRPFGRYEKGSEGRSGEEFREKWLRQSLLDGEYVIVDLTGYNRYGASFIDEAFGGLVRNYKQLTPKYLRSHLEIKHDLLKSVVDLAWDRIDAAAQ